VRIDIPLAPILSRADEDVSLRARDGERLRIGAERLVFRAVACRASGSGNVSVRP
jgi:hypothetical protein